ncbi:MAG: methionyl-tRNA formyltransferase [Minisyncoccota bacterium]
MNKINFVFFGSSKFSEYVLSSLRDRGFEPILNVTSARDPIPDLPDADVYIVASFGKILPDSLIYKPRFKTLNVHPSLLPKLRGPAPIQGAILSGEETGVSIMRLNDKMDQGPVLAQKEVIMTEKPMHYLKAEEILGKAGGELLAEVLPMWVSGEVKEVPQNENDATYTKMIKKEHADITNESPEQALRKIRAYEVWPRARVGDLIVTGAHIEDGKLILDKVIPPGKKEMVYKDYLRGKH